MGFEFLFKMLTYKLIAFVESPMDLKPVTAVPGIGKVIGGWLMQRGITTAHQLYSYYLSHGEWEFKNLIFDCHGNKLNQDRAYYAMKFWYIYRGWGSIALHFYHIVQSHYGLPPAAIYTEKMITFLREPIFNRPVKAVPGVDEAIGRKLRLTGICTALDLYHFYYHNSEEKFKSRIEQCGGDKRWQNVVYCAMMFWENIRMQLFSHWEKVTDGVCTYSELHNMKEEVIKSAKTLKDMSPPIFCSATTVIL